MFTELCCFPSFFLDKSNVTYCFLFNPTQDNSKALDTLRQEFEAEAAAMEAKSVKRIKALQTQLDLKRKTELVAQEEKKNNFLSSIISNHEKTFEEMKKYYTDITATNLKLITELKVCFCMCVCVWGGCLVCYDQCQR